MEKKKSAESPAWFATGINENASETTSQEKFDERVRIVNEAIELKEPERIPFCMFIGTAPYTLAGGAYKNTYYDFEKASEDLIRYYLDFQPDATTHTAFTSGKANELAGSTMIDWPGRPGTSVPDNCTHQVIENVYMEEDEYKEILEDFTGFMLRKYIPRVFPNLSGLSGIKFVPSMVLNTNPLASLYTPGVQQAISLLAEIGKEDAKAAKASDDAANRLAGLGFPPLMTGAGEAPFDIIGDYYRGTLAILTDQLEYEDEIEELCYRLADIQIASWEYFKFVPLPVKRVFFPLHKGVDGFMSPAQYERLYWKPLKKCMTALIDMGVTPYIYTEGKYNSRLEQLLDVPKGKVLYHFENVDIKRAKQLFSGTAAICGNFPIYLLEYGTKEQVADEAKKLLDICAPGGGYIFDCNGSVDGVKRENLEVLRETVDKYGRK